MIDINQLAPITELPGIESRFKAFAGPGAGKTTWLVQHIKRILKETSRLGSTRKIACITYTNIAAEQLLSRMSCDLSRIEVSTIHSFLYNNVIKPFAHLIGKDNVGETFFKITELHGHEEHIPHSDRIRRWLTTIEQSNGKRYGYLNAKDTKPKLFKYLSNLDYKLDNEGKIDLYCRQYVDVAIPKANGELWVYKRKYWSDGLMHHEDVLYFAYYIIKKSPRVLEFIRNRFPYIFVDEFQDTTTLQTIIVKMISDGDTTIGVIGDLAQSIYKFAGAVRSDFENLHVKGMSSYKLEQNFRSTQTIIDYLNMLRADIEQKGFEDTKNGNPVTLLIGTQRECYRWVLENVSPNTVAMAIEHTDIEKIRADVAAHGDNLIKKMFAEDSNSQRARFIHSILLGFRWLERKNNKQAVKIISQKLKAINSGASQFSIRKASIFLLEQVKMEVTQNMTVHDFYLQFSAQLVSLFQLKSQSRFSAGNAQTFYKSCTVQEVLPFVKIDTQSEEMIRTIHSSKGAEFDNVLVCLQSIGDLERYVFGAKERLNGEADEARVYYVGFSRAKNNLFIAVPEFKSELLPLVEKNKIRIIPMDKK